MKKRYVPSKTGDIRKQQKKWVLAYTVSAIAVAALLAYSASRIQSQSMDGMNITRAQLQFNLIQGTFYGTLYLSAAVLFLLGISQFKNAFKKSYIFIALGIALIAFATTLMPFAYATGTWDHFLLKYMYWVPVWGAATCIIIGLNIFKNIVGIKRIVSGKFLAGLGAIYILLVTSMAINHKKALVPLTQDVDSIAFRFLMYGIVLASYACLLAVAAHMTRRLRYKVGINYAKALAWFYVALVAQTVAVICLFMPYVIGAGYKKAALADLALRTVAIILFIKSAQSFNEITKD